MTPDQLESIIFDSTPGKREIAVWKQRLERNVVGLENNDPTLFIQTLFTYDPPTDEQVVKDTKANNALHNIAPGLIALWKLTEKLHYPCFLSSPCTICAVLDKLRNHPNG